MGKKKKPVPPPPPREVHISVWGNGQLVADRVSFAGFVPEPAPYNVAIDVVPYQDPGGPRLRIVLPPEVQYGWGAHLTIRVPGYQDYQARVAISPDLDVSLTPIPVNVDLPRLVPSGQFFRQADGTPFTVIDATDFSLYSKFMEGINIEPVLQQRRDVGFNMVRVFGVSQNPWPGYHANVTPARYGDAYYQGLKPFFALLAKYHLYCDWVAFISNGEVPPEGQLQHWGRLNAVLKDITNVIVSAINEDSAHPASRLATLQQLTKPIGVVASHGSNGGSPDGANGLPPPVPYWDWAELHTNDTFEWTRKVGHNTMELSNTIPCVATENTRAADRFQSTAQAFDAAAGAALLCAGSTFHSWTGRESGLWSGLELDLAKAWVAGAKSVPLTCQAGPYRHGQSEMAEEIAGNYLRVYQRGSDSVCRVRIRR